jgi:hypothetical protein
VSESGEIKGCQWPAALKEMISDCMLSFLVFRTFCDCFTHFQNSRGFIFLNSLLNDDDVSALVFVCLFISVLCMTAKLNTFVSWCIKPSYTMCQKAHFSWNRWCSSVEWNIFCII